MYACVAGYQALWFCQLVGWQELHLAMSVHYTLQDVATQFIQLCPVF